MTVWRLLTDHGPQNISGGGKPVPTSRRRGCTGIHVTTRLVGEDLSLTTCL